MKIKELEAVVHMAWSPANLNRIMIATGTTAQQLDPTFNTNSKLEIHSLNIEEVGLEMKRLASINVDSRFYKIVWSSSAFTDGIIVGGSDNGQISAYNASKLLEGDTMPLLANQKKHSGSVKTLDLNHFQNNLLASGSMNSEIFIWDLNNLNKTMTPGSKCQPLEEVLSVAWNRQVEHILASVLSTKCMIWDLRKNEPIIKLTDSNTRAKWRSIAWHPDIATQLCLASDDDNLPVIQLWDLRYATAPLKVFQKHERGVLDISWCHQDAELLLSSGKDNKILCWNPNSNSSNGEVLAEIAHTNQWNFDISWCQRNPTLLSSCSFDGFLTIHSIMGGSAQQSIQTSSKIQESFAGVSNLITPPPQITLDKRNSISHDIIKAPKWMKKPISASFGFGGKLIVINNNKLTNSEDNVENLSPIVNIYKSVINEEFLEKSKILSTYCANDNFYEYCCWKQSQNLTNDQKQIWDFLTINFDSNPRAHLLQLLGIQSNSNSDNSNMFEQNCNNYDNIGFKENLENGKVSSKENIESLSVQLDEFQITDDTDGDITKALLIGDFRKAVNLCVKQNRMTDAILIAMNGDLDLLKEVQNIYFSQNMNNVTAVISTLISKDWSKIIDTCNLHKWKEVLSAIAAHCLNDNYYVYLGKLAKRLMDNNFLKEALLCFICSGYCDEFINCYGLIDAPKKSLDAMTTFELIEIITVLQVSMQKQNRCVNVSKNTANLFFLYVSMLIAQGDLDTAIQYVDMNDENTLSDLKNCLIANLKSHPIQNQGHAMNQRPIQQIPQQKPIQYQQNRDIYAQRTPPPVQPQFTPFQPQIQQQIIPPMPSSNIPLEPMQTTVVPPPLQTMSVQPPLPPPLSSNLQKGSIFSKTRRLIDPSVTTKTQPGNPFVGDQMPSYTAPVAMQSNTQPIMQPPIIPAPFPQSPSPRIMQQPPPIQQMQAGNQFFNPTPVASSMYQNDQSVAPAPQIPQIPTVTCAWNDPPMRNAVNLINENSSEAFNESGYDRKSLPESYLPIQQTFNGLRYLCLKMSNNSQMKRKMDDVAKKLDILFDMISQNRVTQNTINQLLEMVNYLQNSDYKSALDIYMKMVSGPDFSQIANFMPGIKMLIQNASQLNIVFT